MDEWIIVYVIKSMYKGATAALKVNGRMNKAFVLRVRVH